MPELPEVETIARKLRPVLIGQTILQAEVLWPGCLVGLSAEEFDAQISGQRIEGISRRAKYLDLQLTTLHLLIHLRMSGDLTIQNAATQPARHDRLIVELANQRCLVFNDPRKFGRDPG